MRIFCFFVTQNQTQISSKTRRILKMTIPKLSKEILKYVSDKQPYSNHVEIPYGCQINDVGGAYAALEQTLLSIPGSSSNSLVSSVLLKRHLFPAR